MDSDTNIKQKSGGCFTRQRGTWGDFVRIVICLIVIKVFGIIIGLIASAIILFLLPKIFKGRKDGSGK